METINLLFPILTGINTAIIIDYLKFRFELAEKYVLKRDHDEIVNKIFEKLDKILEKLEQKEDKIDKKG